MRLNEKSTTQQLTVAMDIPTDGLPMTVFGEMLKCRPSDVPEVVRYLHRKQKIWSSKVGGHIRVFPISMKPGRGRPRNVKRNVAVPFRLEILELLAALVPNFVLVRQLLADRPSGHKWSLEKFANDQGMIVESAQIMLRVRKFSKQHPELPPEAIRDALWFDRPDLMEMVAEHEEQLSREATKAFTKPEKRPRNMEANLEPDDRIHRYVQRAGKNGIAAYEISKKFRGAIDTDEVTRIAVSLEEMGLIHVIEVRKEGKGRKTARLFDIQFTPDVTENGTFYMR